MIIFVCALFISIIKSEDYIEHLNWRTKVKELSKHWMSYVEKWMDTTVKKLATRKINILTWLMQVNNKTVAFSLNANEIIKVCKQKGLKMTSPITLLNFHANKCYRLSLTKISFRALFILHQNLRLNMTFYKIKLRNTFGDCLENVIHVLSVRKKRQLEFCGIH